jgi:hypothetical protein
VYCSTWASSVARCLIIISFLSFTFGSKNNNNFKVGTILNKEASVLENFFQVFSMASTTFSKFSTIPKIIN